MHLFWFILSNAPRVDLGKSRTTRDRHPYQFWGVGGPTDAFAGGDSKLPDRGRNGALICLAPPSEPCMQISPAHGSPVSGLLLVGDWRFP